MRNNFIKWYYKLIETTRVLTEKLYEENDLYLWQPPSEWEFRHTIECYNTRR